MFSSDRRDSTEIAFELLTLVKCGASKHQMVRDANLNSRLATRYTTQLEEMRLIQREANSKLSDKYRLTSRGEKVLKILSQLQTELDAWDKVADNPSYHTAASSELICLPLTGREDLSSTRRMERTKSWIHTVRHLVGYLLVVLAGMGLGYLFP